MDVEVECGEFLWIIDDAKLFDCAMTLICTLKSCKIRYYKSFKSAVQCRPADDSAHAWLWPASRAVPGQAGWPNEVWRNAHLLLPFLPIFEYLWENFRTIPGTIEWLRERTEHLDIFLFSAHHWMVSYFRCSVYWSKGMSDFSVLKYY